MHKISIIVPVHNTERYLASCVESLTSQTYKNIEIVLVENASSSLDVYPTQTNEWTVCSWYGRSSMKHLKIGN